MSRTTRVAEFAVLRIESDFKDPVRDARLLKTEPGLLISVVSVWLSEDLAATETKRLIELNAGKGMTYLWQQTRLDKEISTGEGAGGCEPSPAIHLGDRANWK